jgi:DinB family protein
MNKILARLDSIREKLLGTVGTLEPEIYSKRPSEGEWSVAEIMHHLALVEARVIKELEGALARPPQRLGVLRRLIPTFIVAVRLVKVKAPGPMNPKDSPDRDEAIANSDRIRSSLKKLCDDYGRERLNEVVFKHPFLGEISGVATVSFLGYHEQRHHKQIREVLKKASAADPRG